MIVYLIPPIPGEWLKIRRTITEEHEQLCRKLIPICVWWNFHSPFYTSCSSPMKWKAVVLGEDIDQIPRYWIMMRCAGLIV